jgi:hypothetical protein
LEIGPLENSEAAFKAEYQRVTSDIEKTSGVDIQRIWEESETFTRKVDFAMALIDKGFRIPVADEAVRQIQSN